MPPLHPRLVQMARLALELPGEWPAVDTGWIAAAERHGVLPLLIRRGGPIDLRTRITRTLAESRARIAVVGLDAAAAFAALDAAGVAAASFKGFALARRLYPEEVCRPLMDADLLVSAHDFDRAAEALTAAGFHRKDEPARPGMHAAADSWIFFTPHGAAIDLHRGVSRARVFPVDHGALLARSRAGGLPGERWLDETDELLLTCLHHTKHALRVRLVQVLDAVLLAADARTDWDRLVADARRCRATRAVWISLAWVRAIDPARVPDQVMTALRPEPLRVRVLDAVLPSIGPRPDGSLAASRAEQAFVYGLTAGLGDLAVDVARYAGERFADAVSRARTPLATSRSTDTTVPSRRT